MPRLECRLGRRRVKKVRRGVLAVVMGLALAPVAKAEEARRVATEPGWVVAPVPRDPAPSSPRGSAGAPEDQAWTAAGVARLDPKLDLAIDLVAWSHGDLARDLRNTPEDAGFVLRRARLGLAFAKGDWEARFDEEVAAAPPATVAPDPLFPLGPRPAAPRPTEAYVAYAPSAAFRVAAGSQRVPLSWARLMDPADAWLGQLPWPVERILPDYRLGFTVGGDLGLLQYAAGWFGPAADTVERFAHEGSLWVFRLSGEPVGPMGNVPWRRTKDDPWYPWWRFSHALSFAWAHLPDAGTDALVVTGDQAFSWRRFSLMAEILWQRRMPAVAGAASVDALAVWAEAGVFLLPDRWSLAARFDWMNGEVGTREATDSWGVTGGTELALGDPAAGASDGRGGGPRVFLRLTGDRRWQRFGNGAAEAVRLSVVLTR